MDSTVLQRQHRRIERLKLQGLRRSTVLVHENCRPVLNGLRPHLVNPERGQSLNLLLEELNKKDKPTNIAQVRHLSPFRYPGGKTWLVPEVRRCLLSASKSPKFFVEPFAGGAIVGLSVAAENLAQNVFLSEIDEDVAAVWEVVFNGLDEDVSFLSRKICEFDLTAESAKAVIGGESNSLKEKAFRTIIKNRAQRGGIMAAGAGLIRTGEGGRGIKSRWYPETLVKRIETVRELKTKISFERKDAFEVIHDFANIPETFFFIDPPYTVGGKKAGSRLYTYNKIDHEKLFSLMATVHGTVMMSYDDTPEVREMADHHGFRVERIPMKNTHHSIIHELLVMKV